MITLESLIILAILLFTKHLVADGPLQTRYQVINKGRFLHPGGLIHSGWHVALTGLFLLLWALAEGFDCGGFVGGYQFILWVMMAEFVIHYTVDFIKCRVDQRYQWSSVGAGVDGDYLRVNDVRFFYAFLIDQTLHSFTYLGIVYWVSRCGA